MIALPSSNSRLPWVAAKLPVLTSALLVILVTYSFATLLWQIVLPPPPDDTVRVDETRIFARTEGQRPRDDLQIAQLHLFGKPSIKKEREAPTAPKTRLNLILRGVLATGGEDALAIIASGGADERFYHVGDAIPGGATLKAVYPDRVLLERNLNMETLPLPKSQDAGIEFSTNSGTSDVSRLGSPRVAQKLSQLRTQVLRHPEKLGKMIQAKPLTQDGRFKGYQLSPRGNPELFNNVGLQSGDIVIAVNGVSIDRPEKGLNALQKLVNASEVTVTVLRDGSEVTIHHDLASDQ
jgi:general secretion pathway protein C